MRSIRAASPAISAFVDARMHDDGAAQSDTKSIATGYGVTSMEALKSGKIDAFIAWPGLFASFQNAGYKLTILPDAAWQIGYYGIGQAATRIILADHQPQRVWPALPRPRRCLLWRRLAPNAQLRAGLVAAADAARASSARLFSQVQRLRDRPSR